MNTGPAEVVNGVGDRSLWADVRRRPVAFGVFGLVVLAGVVLAVGEMVREVWLSRGGADVDSSGLGWLGLLLVGAPQLWLARIRGMGPFSADRKRRALFWRIMRLMLLVNGTYLLAMLTFVVGVTVFGAWRTAVALGGNDRITWAEVWTVIGDGAPRLVLYMFAYAVGGFAMLIAGRRMRGFVRRLEGKCVKCAYLLTGLTEARCPECGAEFDAGELEVTDRADDSARHPYAAEHTVGGKRAGSPGGGAS